MTPDAYAVHMRTFRDLTAEPSTTTSSDDLLRQAETLAAGLGEEEREVASTLYLLRLLKESHRQAVVAVERTATHRRAMSGGRTPEEQLRLKRDREAYEADRAEADRRLFASLNRIAEEFAADLRMQWTAELLASTFALPDGTLVAWGDATREQHEERRDMLVGNAKGNLEAASRHAAAITALDLSGAPRLREALVAA